MYYRIYNFLSVNNVLSDNQFGFRKGRSCEHALLTAQNEIINNLNKKSDISKLADTLHDQLADNFEIRCEYLLIIPFKLICPLFIFQSL